MTGRPSEDSLVKEGLEHSTWDNTGAYTLTDLTDEDRQDRSSVTLIWLAEVETTIGIIKPPEILNLTNPKSKLVVPTCVGGFVASDKLRYRQQVACAGIFAPAIGDDANDFAINIPVRVIPWNAVLARCAKALLSGTQAIHTCVLGHDRTVRHCMLAGSMMNPPTALKATQAAVAKRINNALKRN